MQDHSSRNSSNRNSIIANTNSTSMHGTHVWVRTDLVEAIWNNGGQLPKGWKPRKRGRSSEESSWGWARALVVTNNAGTGTGASSTTTPNQSPDRKGSNKNDKSPFGTVQLRKITNSPMVQERSGTSSSWLGTPERSSKTVSITVTIDDPEFAPPELQNVTVSFTYDTGEYSKVCMANTWWQTGDEPPQDLTSLSHLHEPAVVFCLQQRYEWDYIYSYTGKVLLALNPFRPLEKVYSEDVMQQYWDQDFSSGRPPPHIFAVAEDAYRSMMRSLQQDNTNKTDENQSILVSGESGAGKTVTTKIVMRYLATLSQRLDQSKAQGNSADVGIESQVLQSNPILESFGNARTVRNDNSSRFGKFIEIQFARSGCLISASIETYLLEKVRLISQAPGERNYHVFYELLAGLPQKDRRDLKIGNVNTTDFRMTAASGTFDRRDGVEDKETYLELKSALDTVGFTRDEQMDLFTVVCALLHSSNLTFKESAADDSELDRSNPSLRSVVELLGVEVDTLNDALCRCAIQVQGETLYKHLSVERAEKAAEALIKTTYAALFDHIVRRINSFITVRQRSNQGSNAVTTASIGVLDIFGFESFERNSFEQLCINFCNEALQQQFNRFVFKLEQQEYKKEGIEWAFIAFPDNQDVLDLIEKKHDGILSVLDEQCRLPRCSDKSFASAIYAKCSGHPRFEATKAQQGDLAFGVHHYAGMVEYDTFGFLEKNKDELPKETTELLLSSSYPFLARLGRELSEGSSLQQPTAQRKALGGSRKQLHRAASSLMRDSVGSQFCSQLRELRTRIESTSPHYVRCLKPNDDLVPNNFDHIVIADQLRCAGVLEAIRVSRVGFPHRYFHDHFVQRYRILGGSKLGRSSRKEKAQELCEALVNALVPQLSQVMEQSERSEEVVVQSRHGKSLVFLGMQMGRTKVFLRLRAFEALEHLRSTRINAAAASIQSMARMFIERSRFEIAVFAASIIQNFVRLIGTHRAMKQQRLYDSATAIQNAWKCFVPRRRLNAGRCIAWWCQSIYRGTVARQYCAYLFLDGKASSIQRRWKRYCASRTFRRIRKAVVRLQNRQRSRLAFRELLRLRREARDLSSVAAERDTLRRETLKLRKELEQVKQSPPVDQKLSERKESEAERLRFEVQRLQLELEKAHRMTSPSKSFDADLQSLIDECARKEEQLDVMRRELDAVRTLEFPESPSFVRSFAFDQSPVARSNNGLTGSFHLSSPARADVSLLDAEGEGPTATEGAISFQSLRVEQSANRSFASVDMSEGPTGEEVRHLNASIRHGKNQLFDQVLRQSNDPIALIHQGDNFGRTSLHLAVQKLNLKLVETLIGNGAVANTNDNDGETPLHLAENAAMTELLLKKGKANPNIPNVDGICALHLAVQRRDIDSVRALLRSGASVNNADNIRWFTALHLISLPARNQSDDRVEDDLRSRIAQLLSGSYDANEPDFDYQDSEGNTPLHYAVQLETPDACDLVTIFLEKGADPNICNDRDQSPLHLLCHNEELRNADVYQEILHAMLFHGADPNLQSMTGCTPMHLSLYHRDVDSAVQLVSHGAELHVLWRKPTRWVSFWDDMGASEILALDMVEEETSLHRILSAVTRPVKWAPSRSWCMHCKNVLGTYSRALHCGNCSRLVCGNCAPSCLPPEDFPKSFEATQAAWVCTVCEKILAARKEDMSSGTQPLSSSSYGDDEEDRFSC